MKIALAMGGPGEMDPGTRCIEYNLFVGAPEIFLIARYDIWMCGNPCI